MTFSTTRLSGAKDGVRGSLSPPPEINSVDALNFIIVCAGMQERSVDGDDDLERLGYTVYAGNKQNRYTLYGR